MARPLRVDIADGWYHVAGRGIDRRSIYTDDRDRTHFLELLEALCERYRVVLHAYVLMSNHYHLILQTPEANLSEAMQWLSVSYSMWYNKRHGRVGPLFQGRFKSILIENSSWGYEASLYIHLNPVVRLGLGLSKSTRKAEARGYRKPSKDAVKKRLRELRSYQWSSYRAYAGYMKSPDWLDTKELLNRASKSKEQQAGRYRKDLEARLTQGVTEPFAESMKNGFALGAESFLNKIRAEGKMGRETSGKRSLRKMCTFGQMVKYVEDIRGVAYDEIIGSRGDWGKPLIMWGARNYCGLTLREIGESIGGMDYGAVTMSIRRFEKRVDKERALKSAVKVLSDKVLNVKT